MNTGKPSRPGPSDTVTGTVERRRRLQDRQRELESRKDDSGFAPAPTQAGERRQPTDMPAQGLDQPGRESDLGLAPRFMAPGYLGSAKLQDMAALVTGGDSGIGRAVAVLFAREGADVCIVALSSEEDARETCRRVEAEGRRAEYILGDVKDPAFCRKAVDHTVGAFGRLDILVNNAAEQHPRDSVRDISEAQLEKTFRTNIFAMFHLTAAALPHLEKAPAPVIINTASVTAYRGSPKLLDYSATKGAIVSFTRSLSGQLAGQKIRVNAVAPGPIWTPLIPSTFAAEKVASFGSDTPLGRAGEPWECAECFVFLASDAAAYITGQVLHPNGGEIING